MYQSAKINQNQDNMYNLDKDISINNSSLQPTKINNLHKGFFYKTNQIDHLNDISHIITPTKKKVMQSKSQSLIKKIIINLNKRFKVLNCLDIEYQPFKQIFFRSKDNTNQLYQQCFQRNSLINRQILRYNKQFNEYLQRKQQVVRKNKFIDDQQNQQNIKMQKSFNNQHSINNSRNKQKNKMSLNFMKRKSNNHTDKNKTQYNLQNFNSKLKVSPNRDLSNFTLYNEVNQSENNIDPDWLISASTKNSFLDSSFLQKKPNTLLVSIKPSQSQISQIQFKDHNNVLISNELFELSCRKKNLNLKKIDISLASLSGVTDLNKFKNKKTQIKQINMTKRQIIKNSQNTSIRRNYLQQKYQKVLQKKIIEQITQKNQQVQSDQSQLTTISRNEQNNQFELSTPKGYRKHIINSNKHHNQRSPFRNQFSQQKYRSEKNQISLNLFSPTRKLTNLKRLNIDEVKVKQKQKLNSLIQQKQISIIEEIKSKGRINSQNDGFQFDQYNDRKLIKTQVKNYNENFITDSFSQIYDLKIKQPSY